MILFGVQIGWEISKVVETLKASGHEVSLVINTGSSSTGHTSPSGDLRNGDQADTGGVDVTNLDDGALRSPYDESCDRRLSANQNSDPFVTSTSHSTNYSDGMSSSQDTLDDIAESPASFEGDTDFSGMEKILVKSKVLDLHRTSSAPLTHREKAVVLEESGSSSGGGHGEGKGPREVGSLDCLDGASVESGGGGISSDNPSYESRLQMRTASDGTVEKSKKQVRREGGLVQRQQ